MDTIACEIRFAEDPDGPGRLVGTLLTYEQRASDRPEVFKAGALTWPKAGVVIDRQHDRFSPIVRALPFVEGNAVKIDVKLPDTTAGRDAAQEVRSGLMTGLSVEFQSRAEGRRGGLREIRQAFTARAGLVDDPSYTESKVDIRSKSRDPEDEDSRYRLWL